MTATFLPVLPTQRDGRMDVLLDFVIGDEPLQVLDGDRLVDVRPPAVRFAGTDADPAQGPGHADALADRGERIGEPLFADLLHVTWGYRGCWGRRSTQGAVTAYRYRPSGAFLPFRDGIGKGLGEVLERVEDGVHAGLTDRALGPLPDLERKIPDTGQIFLPPLSGGDLLRASR